jgi:[acyl-carrier-protein] S-malonyltransferase
VIAAFNYNPAMILCRSITRNFTKTSHLNLRGGRKIQDLLDNAAIGEDRKPKSAEDTWSTSPYPADAVFNNSRRDQSKNREKSFKDPRETTIILFPGQGAQYVGMARSLIRIPEAKDMYELASEVLG